jgi:hypothetical protein
MFGALLQRSDDRCDILQLLPHIGGSALCCGGHFGGLGPGIADSGYVALVAIQHVSYPVCGNRLFCGSLTNYVYLPYRLCNFLLLIMDYLILYGLSMALTLVYLSTFHLL